MIEELEKKLEEMFVKANVGSWLCPENPIEGAKQVAERWKKTTKYMTKTEENYLDALKLRLRQGNVEI